MPYSLPNQINNGDSIDATPVQGNFDSIKNEINNIETAQTTDGSNITALKTTVEEGGWSTEAGTLAYASVDGPTQTSTIAGDLRARYHPGTRLKYNQNQAIQNYWSFDTNSADSKGSATMANIGTPTYTAGKFGNALTLNGTNQALSITDAASLKPTDNFTIGCWFKTSNTGVEKRIFQSYSGNTNANGIKLWVSSTNLIYAAIGNNSASDTTVISGTTVVTDGNWHYVVWSMRNNFSQVYLDGKLETSGYSVTPTYHATNYVRIGCGSTDGSNVVWFNGQIDDLFIAAYALDEQTIAAKYAAATAQGTGDLTLTKYALVTASSYSAPNTTVTIYSGTDHTMMNATVSNAYYSTQKAPYGFPLGQEKWKIEFMLIGNALTKNSPVAGTWYNTEIGSPNISVPIGKWNIYYSVAAYMVKTDTAIIFLSTLSRSSSSETDTDMKRSQIIGGASGVLQIQSSVGAEKPISASIKTPYYLIVKTDTASATAVGINAFAPTVIRATSTLL